MTPRSDPMSRCCACHQLTHCRKHRARSSISADHPSRNASSKPSVPPLKCSYRRQFNVEGDQDFFALHDPVAELRDHEPDIDVPEKLPVYRIACDPTVPKVILLPCTVPVTLVVPLPSDETRILPLSFEPACCHVSEKVPLNAPV